MMCLAEHRVCLPWSRNSVAAPALPPTSPVTGRRLSVSHFVQAHVPGHRLLSPRPRPSNSVVSDHRMRKKRDSFVAYRNKTYVCFDGDNDINYYWLMTAWRASDNSSFNFHDAHDLNTARDSSQEESIKRQLRARFANSKLFVVLIGNNTKYLRKFVKWEMEVALRLELPIVGVNLDGSRNVTELCPSTIRDELAIYIPFQSKIMQYAMDNWPSSHATHKRNGDTGAYFYKQSVYSDLGL